MSGHHCLRPHPKISSLPRIILRTQAFHFRLSLATHSRGDISAHFSQTAVYTRLQAFPTYSCHCGLSLSESAPCPQASAHIWSILGFFVLLLKHFCKLPGSADGRHTSAALVQTPWTLHSTQVLPRSIYWSFSYCRGKGTKPCSVGILQIHISISGLVPLSRLRSSVQSCAYLQTLHLQSYPNLIPQPSSHFSKIKTFDFFLFQLASSFICLF